MTIEEIDLKLKECASTILGLPVGGIHTQDNLFDQLGMDSIDAVEFHMQIEDSFKIELQDEDLYGLKTIEQYTKFIADYLDKRIVL